MMYKNLLSNSLFLFKGGGQKQRFRVGKLHLVDLAGSERQSKTGATGQRLKEATKVRQYHERLFIKCKEMVRGYKHHLKSYFQLILR